MKDILKPSGDYMAMQSYWKHVADITAGVEAMRTTAYLPNFPNESIDNHAYRMRNSVLVDIVSDIVESLASKPFAKEAGLADDNAPPIIQAFVEDIDREDNHLHIFAQQVFLAGIFNAVDWVLVDYPSVPAGATLADERAIGARPYLVRIKATDMLEVRSDIIGGREQFTYARINESGHDEAGKAYEQIRLLLNDEQGARFEVWRKDYGQDEATLRAAGAIAIGEIPLVPFFTGRRESGSWRFTMPMKRVVDLQLEHYQAATNLKLAKEQTAFPMLVGAGISPPVDDQGQQVSLPVGPGTVLYAPMNDMGAFGDWKTLEPNANTLKFLSDELLGLETTMRELGRQPLTAGTAGLTQVAVAFSSQRASSAVQAWAYMLKDCLERALRYMAAWENLPYEPLVHIDTDFAIELGDTKAPEILVQLQAAGLISHQTLIQELKRRGILSPEVEDDKEQERLLAELAGNSNAPSPRDSVEGANTGKV